jgi:CIC family chloride channel protein
MREKLLIIYLISIILGILTGVVGSLFQIAIEQMDWLISYLFDYFNKQSATYVFLSSLTSMLMVLTAWLMVKRLAPEAGGSGVQEIEGTLLHERPIFWRRLIPVKFIGGILAISAKMVLGREGPTIQMGGNLGEMVGEIANIPRSRRDTLIAAGSAAGLATAFNAPLAGVLFVIEEMRNEFNFSFTNFKMVAICCVMATITLHAIIGSHPAIPMDVFQAPALNSLWLFFIFGLIVGLAGLIFNIVLMFFLHRLDNTKPMLIPLYVAFAGALVGLLWTIEPETVGGGYRIIHEALTLSPSIKFLAVLLIIRFFTTMLCYSTGVPGGIFAPMLALGTLLGLFFVKLLVTLGLNTSIAPGVFAVAGMGALFSAAVRAPVTGIILVVEMTQNYLLILPLMVTCLTATMIVQLAANPPIYLQLLRRTINLQGRETGMLRG